MGSEIGAEQLDLGTELPSARVRGTDPSGDVWRSVQRLELVTKRHPPLGCLGVRLAISLADRSERVRAGPDRRAGLGSEALEAAVTCVIVGACSLHRLRSIRAAHGQATSYAVVPASGSGPGTDHEPRSSGRKQSADGALVARSAGQCFPSGWMRTSRCVPGNVRARSSTSAGGSSGNASDGMRCVSAIQIGKFVMTGPAVASRGWPAARIRDASSSYRAAVVPEPDAKVDRRT